MIKTKVVKLNDEIIFGDIQKPFVLIAGPCVLEGLDRSLKIGEEIKRITSKLGIPYIFKASFDKANRSSVESYRGPGLETGLNILEQIKKNLGVPVISDIHTEAQAELAAEVLDIIQIPAFLSRQTDLLLAAAKTGKIINVKKGQFMAPWDMEQVVNKIVSVANHNILLTERGTSFGYNRLVVDMTSLSRMRKLGYPVVFDGTHSVQLPGGQGNVSGGEREYVEALTRGAIAIGIDALFLEVHDNPSEGLSDGANMVAIADLEAILSKAIALDQIIKDRCL